MMQDDWAAKYADVVRAAPLVAGAAGVVGVLANRVL